MSKHDESRRADLSHAPTPPAASSLNQALHHSRFSGFIDGNGGEKRTAQLLESLPRDFDLSLTALTERDAKPGLSALLWAMRHSHRICGRWCSPNAIWQAACLYQRYAHNFGPGRPDLLVWESNVSMYTALPFIARHLGCRVWAFPHNLESLVPTRHSDLSNRPAPHWFHEELAALRSCDRVLTLSREEQWLLRLHDVPAEYYPYELPEPVRERASRIRDGRHLELVPPDQRFFLVFGTVTNPPSGIGTGQLLDHFVANGLASHRIVVAGVGTKKLARNYEGTGLEIKGRVDSEALEALLRRTDAVIVHQAPTSGVLTRIPELLAAGVPVLANENASRSWFNATGVHTYETFDDLAELMWEFAASARPRIVDSGPPLAPQAIPAEAAQPG